MTDRVILPEKLGSYTMGAHLDSGWGWDLYEASLELEEGGELRACCVRIFFNQPKEGHLHSHLIDAGNKIAQHPHLHIQRILDVQHVELKDRISAVLVEEERLKDWAAPKPADYRAVMLQLLSAVAHLKQIGLPGIGLSRGNLARSRNGKAVLACLAPNWEMYWAGRSRAGDRECYFRLPPESAEAPGGFDDPQWVWSAGSLLLESLVGMFWEGRSSAVEDVFDTPISSYVNHASDDCRESQLARLPDDIQRILRRALAPHPQDRFPNLLRFSEALEIPIKTGKPGDRCVMPAASAVQELSSPPKNTVWAFAVGALVLVLVIAVALWVAAIRPAGEEGASLFSSEPGRVLESDTSWKSENPRTQLAAASEEKPVESESKPVDNKDLAAEPSVDEDSQQSSLPEKPGFSEEVDGSSELKEEVSSNETRSESAPGMSIIPPSPSAPTEAGSVAGLIQAILRVDSDWKEKSEAFSSLNWDQADARDQERVLTAAPTWVEEQKSMLASREDFLSQNSGRSEIQAFWAVCPPDLQSVPEVAAWLEEIKARQSGMRIQIVNETGEEITILDGNRMVSAAGPGDSAILEFPAGTETWTLRAQGVSAGMFTNRQFQCRSGRDVSWVVTELVLQPARLVPEMPEPDDEIKVEFSKHNSSESRVLLGELDVLPGDYRFTYTRPDYFPVSKVLRFSKPGVRYRVRLPARDKWIPNQELEKLISWERRITEESDRVRQELASSEPLQLESKHHQARLAALQKKVQDPVAFSPLQVE